MQAASHHLVLATLVCTIAAGDVANKTSNLTTTSQRNLRGNDPQSAAIRSPFCEVGATVHCHLLAASQTCAGNQCCPDGTTCPSADEIFADCSKPKVNDCTTGRSRESVNTSVVTTTLAPTSQQTAEPSLKAAEAPTPQPTAEPTPNATEAVAIVPWGWSTTSNRIGGDMNWCNVAIPEESWSLRSNTCGHLKVKALSYNLFWWNLFKKHGGRGGSAGQLISSAQSSSPFDFMGFQECENIQRVLNDAGLSHHYGFLEGEHAVAIAYRKASWQLIAYGGEDVAEDRATQWFGTRPGHWGRFRHFGSGKVVFVLNHHGPLPKNTGGLCGTRATAYNILKVIASNAHADDAVLVVGDFNSDASSKTHRLLAHHLHGIYTGTSFGGVDHIFSSCANVVSRRNLGEGGSDHDALEVVLEV